MGKKMKGSHTGALPLNARVTVDYEKGNVRFSYPRRMDRRRAKLWGFFALYMIFLLGWMLLVMSGVLIVASIEGGIAWSATGYAVDWAAVAEGARTLGFVLAGFLGVPLIPALAIVAKDKWLQTYFPKIGAFVGGLGGKYEAMFRKTHNGAFPAVAGRVAVWLRLAAAKCVRASSARSFGRAWPTHLAGARSPPRTAERRLPSFPSRSLCRLTVESLPCDRVFH